MSKIVDDLNDFVAYASTLDGDEKGEAQVFCDRLFRAFGHEGYKEAGAILEYRIKKTSGKGTSFADLIWKPRLLVEMKKSGEKLQLHVRQAFDYWVNAVPNRPRYVVLCNFNEFWIYDLIASWTNLWTALRSRNCRSDTRLSISFFLSNASRSSITTATWFPGRPPTKWRSSSSDSHVV